MHTQTTFFGQLLKDRKAIQKWKALDFPTRGKLLIRLQQLGQQALGHGVNGEELQLRKEVEALTGGQAVLVDLAVRALRKYVGNDG